MKQKRWLDQAGLRLSRQALRVLKERGIFAQSAVGLEHQHLAKRYVVRGLESAETLRQTTPEFQTLVDDERTVVRKLPSVTIEVQTAVEAVAQAIHAALSHLESFGPMKAPYRAVPGGPTRQQGQFLAFIREFMMRNAAGIAPSHAELQRFFDLTASSVNSMLIRLEQRVFIRGVPGEARAIQIVANPDWIPPLDRPFRF